MKKQLKLRLDEDTIANFKALAEKNGIPYKTRTCRLTQLRARPMTAGSQTPILQSIAHPLTSLSAPDSEARYRCECRSDFPSPLRRTAMFDRWNAADSSRFSRAVRPLRR